MNRIRILLIEDDGDDIDLLVDAFELNKVDCLFDIIKEGDKVFPFLDHATDLPDVIVMDLNLPKVHGREIMTAIKANDRFSRIPLVVLTTSSLQDDINFSQKMGASQFITKPSTVDGFNTTVQAIVSNALKIEETDSQ